ncbi:MAG TPA: hypothetical protein VEQ58_04325, partial [Polyangiaceae bacterium]|nr:hypothetical protein [Polyangiaceae bacterium]
MFALPVLALPLALSSCSSDDASSSGAEGGGGATAQGGSAAHAGTNPSAGKSSSGGAGKAGTSGSGGRTSGGNTGNAGSGSGVPGKPGEVGGCKMFPAEDAWNLDISGLAADATWTKKVNDLVGAAKMHPDYGVDGQDLYGIPLNVVPQNQPAVSVTFDDYPDESDPGPYPFPGPDDVIIEGNDPENCDGDCHLIVVQSGACMLYEGYACEHQQDGWHCANGAKWDLNRVGYGQRPDGWTSADAAGLAIAPGLLRYDEVRAGEVTHALRFTLDCTTDKYVEPASHQAVPGGCDPSDGPPMGTRVRLKADYDISQLSESAQVVLRGMKKYGMILADNGSNFYFQGEANAGWTEDDIEPLKKVPAS